MIRTAALLVVAFLMTGCAGHRPDAAEDSLDISRIRIDATSKSMDGSAEMITRCSGFILTEKQVRDFLTYAAHIKGDEPDKYYRILPCSATGTAVINRRKYNWIIRAGGIGEFYAEKDRFIEVCGKNCCDKVPGIC